MVRSEQSLSIPATCRSQFALLESISILVQCPKTWDVAKDSRSDSEALQPGALKIQSKYKKHVVSPICSVMSVCTWSVLGRLWTDPIDIKRSGARSGYIINTTDAWGDSMKVKAVRKRADRPLNLDRY